MTEDARCVLSVVHASNAVAGKCIRTFLHPRGQQGVYCYNS